MNSLLRHHSGFDDFFSGDPFAPFFSKPFRDPLFDFGVMPVLKRFPTGNMTLLRSSPGYEIKESDSTYEIAIDIPDEVHASDMKVELEENGTVLHVSGERKVEEKNKVVQSRFEKLFTIGSNIDTSKISANLADGVLVLQAPKLVADAEMTKQSITITEKPHEISGEEVVQTNYSDEFDESDWAEEGKDKLKA